MITTRLLRHINALRCLRLLRGGAVMSRADMARILGQTRATVGHAVAELAEAGLVLESETAPSGIGRPGVALRLNPEGAYFIGIDLDSRAINGVVLNLAMEVTHRLTLPAGADFAQPAAMQRRIADLALSLARACPEGRLQGLGLAVPGLVGREGQVLNAPILGWRDHPMQEGLKAALPEGWLVEVGNDAFASAAAELEAGRAAPPEGEAPPADMLLVLLAEGIGAAQIAGGRLIAGAHGLAGELGHMRIACRGRMAKFEALAGAAGFAEDIGAGCAVAEGVARLLQGQDQPRIRALLADWALALALGLANAAHLLDPGRIVLGGPLSRLYPLVADQVAAHLAGLILPGQARPVLQLSRLGADGAALGAAARLRDRLFALPVLDAPDLSRRDPAGGA